jgi:hypothetical protein
VRLGRSTPRGARAKMCRGAGAVAARACLKWSAGRRSRAVLRAYKRAEA